MGTVELVPVGKKSLEQFLEVLGEELTLEFEEILDSFDKQLGDRTFWHVNSTAKGGGVAEMLPHMVGYMKDRGVDWRWLTIPGNDAFFAVTKRLHHALHGSAGDNSPLGKSERKVYEAVSAENARQLLEFIKADDVLILHDPQTAGMVPHLLGKVSAIVWRCHIGHDIRNLMVDLGWSFLSPYLKEVDAYIFSREAYIPSGFDKNRCFLIAPSIDPLSPKNDPMDGEHVRDILAFIGYLDAQSPEKAPLFTRNDGGQGTMERKADILRAGPGPKAEDPVLVQISRWDPLKGHDGVLEGFQRLLEQHPETDAYLSLVGPDVKSVSDDPEGGQVYQDMEDQWRALPERIRKRVQLVSLPMVDVEENAQMVNAIQRQARVLLQKSLQEGFGLTVTEAMWKGKAIIASAVGGIQDQIEHGQNGLMLEDPRDTQGLAELMHQLLDDPKLCARLGASAKQSVKQQFLTVRHLQQYLEILEYLDEEVLSPEQEDSGTR